MGWNLETMQISVRLSSHNSERDLKDEKLWEELKEKIRKLCDEPAYEPISPMTNY